MTPQGQAAATKGQGSEERLCLPFGRHRVPVELSSAGVVIRTTQEGDLLRYLREGAGGTVERMVAASHPRLIVNPVEPVNLPQSISSALMLRFARSLLLEPKGTCKVFVTFPVEVGVFVAAQRALEMVDVFSLVPSKFSLYGTPGKGRVCRYWKSDIYSALPSTNPLHHGIIELTVRNTTSRWVELSRVVFNAYGMKLFFDKAVVAMRAEAKITAVDMAETYFLGEPLREGMKKSLEVYTARRLSTTSSKFVMEHGL